MEERIEPTGAVEEKKELPYNDENVFRNERLEFETFEMYKARRAYVNKLLKQKRKGVYLFVSSAVFKDGKRHVATYRKSDYNKKEEKNEEIHNQDSEESTVQ